MAEEEKSHRQFKIDPDVLDKVEDKVTVMANLWLHTQLIAPVEYQDSAIYNVSGEIENAKSAIEDAMDRTEDIEKMSGNNHISNIANDAAWNNDEALSALQEALSHVDTVIEAIHDYKNVVDELITEHHPEIPEAIEKAELMKELE